MNNLKTPSSPVVCNKYSCQNYLEEPCICYSKYKFELLKKAIKNLDNRVIISAISAKRKKIIKMNNRLDS